jgi:hypothetical protein
MPEVRDLDIDLIKIDAEIQPREKLNRKTLALFCALYRDEGPDALPPIVVFHDADDVLWLSDGHYRYHAACNALNLTGGQRVLRAEVHEGSLRDAIFYAAQANAKHGTPLTWEEKRRLVVRLLQDAEWGQMSDRDIALHIGASNYFVSKIHRQLYAQDASVSGSQVPPTRTIKTQRAGKPLEMTIDKTRRGRRKKAETDTIATPPASPEVPQDAPITDQEEEHTTEIGDGSSSVQTPAITPAKITVTHLDASSQSRFTAEEDALAKAWLAAPYAERKDFLQWVITRSPAELGIDSNPEGFEHIGDVIVEMFKKS